MSHLLPAISFNHNLIHEYESEEITIGKCMMFLIRPFREWVLISKREERKGFLVLGYTTMDENSIIARFGIKN